MTGTVVAEFHAAAFYFFTAFEADRLVDGGKFFDTGWADERSFGDNDLAADRAAAGKYQIQ